MKAYKIVDWGHPAQYVDVPKPSPGHGEILIRVKGVGLCHSDLDMMDSAPGSEPYAAFTPSNYILGHENAGTVEELGTGVTDLKKGEGVVVHHMRHCGVCDYCTTGAEQHCEAFKRGSINMTRGCGIDGGLAEFMVVPRAEVVSIGDSDPVLYAPLTDAGVTAYHAVQTFLRRVTPNSAVGVIGVGGLGAYGVQFLKIMTTAKVFAFDISERRLSHAQELGATEVVRSDANAVKRVMELTEGRGIDFIIDFVGSNETLSMAAAVSRPQGRITLVGMQGGSIKVGWGCMATSCEFAVSLGSTRKDLADVCQLAKNGRLRIDVQKFPFDRIPEAYKSLRQGSLNGRAVIVFE